MKYSHDLKQERTFKVSVKPLNTSFDIEPIRIYACMSEPFSVVLLEDKHHTWLMYFIYPTKIRTSKIFPLSSPFNVKMLIVIKFLFLIKSY